MKNMKWEKNKGEKSSRGGSIEGSISIDGVRSGISLECSTGLNL